MARQLIVAPSAIGDMEAIYLYIARNAGQLTADSVQDGLEKRIAGLVIAPERGNIPKELLAMGRADYRELHFKPYRIFYKLSKAVIEVTAVLDGRRDMNTLLRQRLTR
jgi:toxin ParE1/3/4